MVSEIKFLSYKDLQVWQKAMDLIELIYAHTQSFPVDETYGLVTQMRRAAVSIASNLAEGCSRNSTKEFINFISISYGSLAELETQILIAGRLKYLLQEVQSSLVQRIAEIAKMLNGLSASLKQRLTDRQPLTTDH